MPLSFKELVRFIVDGDPVNQGTINSVLRDLDNNTRYLKEVFDAATLGSTVFARKVAVEIDAAVGMAVYYNVTNSRFERAKATAVVDSNGEAVTADAAHVWGIVYVKHTSTSADLLLTGYASLDIAAAVTGSVTAGMYYLSSSNPGKLVQAKPPVTVGVLQADAAGNVFVNPSFSDVLVDHTHHSVELVTEPAGDHAPPLSTGTHAITEPAAGWSTSLEGWLPAAHTVFNTRPAPTGAKFGYNIEANSYLAGTWPPTPIDNAYIEWDSGGETYTGSAGIALGDKAVIKLDANGIWWMTDCYDTVPWSKDYNTTGGRVYWSNGTTDKIQRANYNGSSTEDVLTGLSDPEGIAIDEAAKKIYWIDKGTDIIKRTNLDGSGTAESLVTGLSEAYGLIIDTSDATATNHKIYWVDAGGSIIKRAKKDGTSVETLFNAGTDSISSPQALALDTVALTDTLYWTDDGTNKVQKGNADGTGSVTDVITGLTTPTGIALDIAASRVYWCDEGTVKIQRGNMVGLNQNIEDLVNTSDGSSGNAAEIATPRGLAIDLVADKIYWVDVGSRKIQSAGKDIPAGESVGARTDIVTSVTSPDVGDNFLFLLPEDNIAKGVAVCPAELPVSLKVWYTRLVFQTANTVVTSLRTAANSKIKITCLQNSTETKATGDLVIDVDFGLLVDSDNTNGYISMKEFNSTTQTFAKGLMVEGIRSSSTDLIISSDHSTTATYTKSGVSDAYQGVLTIGLTKSVLGSEIPIELVRLNGVTEENYQDVLGLGFPKGTDTEYRGQFKIPQALGAAAPVKVKLRFWLLAFADGETLPVTGTNAMAFSYRIIESLTSTTPIKALPTADKTDVEFPGTTLASYAVAKGSYIELETGEISVQNAETGDTSNGQTVLFTLARKGSADGYTGEIHVINQRAVIV